MSSQDDNPFKDDDPFDGSFSDATSEDQPGVRDAAVEDIVIEDSGVPPVDDISDYDDTDEEGIFSSAPPEKKSGSSSGLLVTVAVVAILGAGGFYVYQTPDLMDKIKALVPSGSAIENAIPVASVTPAEEPAQKEPADAAGGPLGDPELANIPQPQPIANVAPVAGTSPVADPAPTADPAVTAAADPVTAPTPTPAVADPSAEPPMPAPPSPEQTQHEVAASTAPAPAPAPTPEVVTSPTPEPEPVKTATADVPPPPAQADLAKADPVPAADIQTSGEGQVIATGVPKSPSMPKVEYFDAPGGKILEGIPAPSMDAKRGVSETIIMVEDPVKPKSKSKKSSPKPEVTASTEQESRVVAANRALRLGRYDAALELYNDLYKANPRDGRILMGRAVALQKLGRSGEAIRAYEVLLAVDEDNPEAMVNMTGLISKEYPAVAIEKLLSLKARHPESAAIVAQLGVAYADAGNTEEAYRSLMSASRMEPSNPQHYFNMAVIAERMKDRARAIQMYEKALETDAVYGSGRAIDRNMIYDRLTRLRG